jgi:peptidoglycan/LPS O-acetylase OafA/YrhL
MLADPTINQQEEMNKLDWLEAAAAIWIVLFHKMKAWYLADIGPKLAFLYPGFHPTLDNMSIF